MESDLQRSVRVGLVTAVALGLLAWLVLKITSGDGLLRDEVSFVTSFATTQGLAQGAEVRYEGVTVGEVEAIDFADDPNVNRILVEFKVRKSLRSRMDRHVHAELKSNGPLGDRLLSLRRADAPTEEPLDEGSAIPSKDPFEFGNFVVGGEDVFADVQSISQSLKVITHRLVAGQGLFGRLLEDKGFGDRTVSDLEVTIAGLRSMVEDATQGKNLLGALTSDEEFAGEVTTSIRRFSEDLETIAGRLEAGEGILGQALRDESDMSGAVTDFRVAAANLRRLTERLDTAEGLAARLLFDEELGESLTAELLETLRVTRSIGTKIDEGHGTLGRLVNDSEVHEGLADIVTGIERSWFVRFLLKRKQKKGFKERVERILRESPDPDEDLLRLMEEVLTAEQAEDDGPASAGRDGPPPAAEPAEVTEASPDGG